MLYTPLEQFQIVPIITFNPIILDFSFTNFLFAGILVILCYTGFVNFNGHYNKTTKKIYIFLSPNAWQKGVELISDITSKLIFDIILGENEKYFPFIALLFNFILLNNLIGLIPYSFTCTSHILVTFTLSLTVFIGINIITVKKYGMKTFSLFLPANTTFFLALLLVPIEFISYIAKPISLGIRLFINLMAGHSLLKVVIGFSWSVLLLENFASLGLVIPMIVLIVLFGLEFGVALVQAYVFIILTCIYVQDGS